MSRIFKILLGVFHKWWGVATIIIISIGNTYFFLEEGIRINVGQMYTGMEGEVYYEVIIFYGIVCFFITLIILALLALILNIFMYIAKVMWKLIRKTV